MIRHKSIATVHLTIILLCGPCAAATPPSPEIMDVQWTLDSFQRIGGKIEQVEQSHTIRFQTEKKLTGKSDCNYYSAEYEIREGNSLSIVRFTNTEAACGPTSKCWEFFDALKAATAFELKDGELRIYYIDRQNFLQFRRQP